MPKPKNQKAQVPSGKKGWTPDDIAYIIADPGQFLSGTIDRETWIKANINLITEYGAEAFLKILVNHLDQLLLDMAQKELDIARKETHV